MGSRDKRNIEQCEGFLKWWVCINYKMYDQEVVFGGAA